MKIRYAYVGLCLVIAFATTGCSKRELYHIEGIATFQGEPLSEVEIMMSPADGRRGSTTTTDKSGHFTMRYTGTREGVPPGEQIVHFRYWPEDPMQGMAVLEGRAKVKGRIGELLAKYGDRTKSPYRYTVEKDVRDLKLEMP
jgi:hypothetical protein